MVITLHTYYQLEEESGVRYDSEGVNNLFTSNNPGREIGTICDYGVLLKKYEEYFTGWKHQYLYLDGVDIPNSFSAWAWFRSDTPFLDNFLIGKWGSWGIRTQFGFIHFEIWLNEGSTYRISAPISGIQQNHFVAVSYDDSTHDIVLYLDGAIVNTGNREILESTNEFTIGAISGGGKYFNGWMDEIGIAVGILDTTDWDWINEGRCYDEFNGISERISKKLHQKLSLVLLEHTKPNEYRGIIPERHKLDDRAEYGERPVITNTSIPSNGYSGGKPDEYLGITPEQHRLDKGVK